MKDQVQGARKYSTLEIFYFIILVPIEPSFKNKMKSTIILGKISKGNVLRSEGKIKLFVAIRVKAFTKNNQLQ